MREEIYDIGGMHCAACSSSIERVTRKIKGVEISEVNLPMNRMRIVYDENLVDKNIIISKIERAGFTAEIHTEEEKPEKKIDSTDELKKQKQSLILSIVLGSILMFISMGQMMLPNLPFPDIINMHTHPVNFAIIQMILAMWVMFLGRNFFTGGLGSLLRGNPNMDSLVALSSGASFIYSLVMTFMISDNHHLVHNLYYESAAVILALISLGKYLEFGSKEKTKEAITKLMNLTPDRAILVVDDKEKEVETSSLKVGDTVLVKAGMKIPADGIVIKGGGSVNEAMITGESLPVTKEEGVEVVGGSLSVDGALYINVTKVGGDTTLAKIIKFVEEAQGRKAPISRTADKVAGVFVPIVIVISIVSALTWLIFGADLPFAVNIFTSILVIACPCAMGLATPTAIIVGTGVGAANGILIRSGEALETGHKVDVCVLDKTGTITEGHPEVTDIVGEDKLFVMEVSYLLEKLSNHPIAKAICEKYLSMNTPKDAEFKDFSEISGKGLSATDSNNIKLHIGKPEYLRELGYSTEKYDFDINKFQREGKTCMPVAFGDVIIGVVAVSDIIKEDSAEAIKSIKSKGVKTVMITGDNQQAAEYIGKISGVDEVIANVMPTDKADYVKKYQQEGSTVMMVGDGINDAPALVQADVGVAIGSGSDIAIDSADIVLIKNKLSDVDKTISLGRHTIKNIKQNLFWAFFYNVLAIPLAAGLFYPAFKLLLTPMIGAIAMSLSSIFVVTNALRLKTKKL